VTLGNLRALTADLPEAETEPQPRRRATERRTSALASPLFTYLAVSVMLVAIWALTGAGYFWPIWPIMGWGLCAIPRGSRGICRSPTATAPRTAGR